MKSAIIHCFWNDIMSKSILNKVTGTIKRYFISGVLVVVPIILTYIVMKFMFEAIDGLMKPIIHQMFGYDMPGLGIVTTLLLVLLAGILTRNFIGAKLYRIGDSILERLPIIRPIYSAAKQLLEAIAKPSMNSFKEVALVEYPRKGVYALSFVSKRVEISIEGKRRKFATVFVPSTPTPISGMVIMVPDEEVKVIDMTIEEGIKFLVSGGVASPELITDLSKIGLKQTDEAASETS